MRQIGNEEFEEALNNKDYQHIMSKAAYPYLKLIDNDDMYTIKLNALWTALSKHDSKKCKFTTYLFNSVIWKCKRYITTEAKRKSRYKNVEQMFGGHYFDRSETDDLIDSLDSELALVIKQKFYYNMTLKDIKNTNGYSHEKASQMIKKGIKKMHDIA